MANKDRLPPIHPGEILREEFLSPLGMSAHQLALALRVPATRINDIVNERRGITADTALRLSRYFGTTARFWMNMQASWELEVAEDQLGKAVRREVLPRTPREALGVRTHLRPGGSQRRKIKLAGGSEDRAAEEGIARGSEDGDQSTERQAQQCAATDAGHYRVVQSPGCLSHAEIDHGGAANLRRLREQTANNGHCWHLHCFAPILSGVTSRSSSALWFAASSAGVR